MIHTITVFERGVLGIRCMIWVGALFWSFDLTTHGLSDLILAFANSD